MASCERLLYAQHIEGCGKKFFEEICRRDLEGVVAKRELSTYEDAFSPLWRRILPYSALSKPIEHETSNDPNDNGIRRM